MSNYKKPEIVAEGENKFEMVFAMKSGHTNNGNDKGDSVGNINGSVNPGSNNHKPHKPHRPHGH